LKSMCQVF